MQRGVVLLRTETAGTVAVCAGLLRPMDIPEGFPLDQQFGNRSTISGTMTIDQRFPCDVGHLGCNH
jgi:hypothetical protein